MDEKELTKVVEDETTIYEIDLECQRCLVRESQELQQISGMASAEERHGWFSAK